MHWAEQAILPHNPDIIFIEYVNDTNDDLYRYTMDSLVRKCLALESKPAVILLEMSYYTKSTGVFRNAQQVHSQVAMHYGVPVISWRDAAEVAINNGKYQWSDFAGDEVHPNNVGNAMLTEMMVHFVYRLLPNVGSVGEPEDFNTPALTNDRYRNARILGRSDVTGTNVTGFTETISPENLGDGWATTNGGSITFNLTFKRLGILAQRTSDDLNGIIDITVDGVKVATIDGNNSGGWGSFWHAQEIVSYSTEQEHTVTVTVVEGSKKAFQLLGWLVS